MNYTVQFNSISSSMKPFARLGAIGVSCVLAPQFSPSVRHSANFANFETLSMSACDCDPTGSRDGGMCDAFSGQCICKQNVEGQRCDRCKYGFFNLRPDDPDGCQGEENTIKQSTQYKRSKDEKHPIPIHCKTLLYVSL